METLYIVIPAYNERDNIEQYYRSCSCHWSAFFFGCWFLNAEPDIYISFFLCIVSLQGSDWRICETSYFPISINNWKTLWAVSNNAIGRKILNWEYHLSESTQTSVSLSNPMICSNIATHMEEKEEFFENTCAMDCNPLLQRRNSAANNSPNVFKQGKRVNFKRKNQRQ